MTVEQVYLSTVDSQRVVILELNKVLYSGFFDDIQLKYLGKIVQKIGVDYEKETLVLCI